MVSNSHDFKDDIPSGWKVKKLEEVAYFKNGKAHEKNIDENGNYILVNSKFISSEGTKYKRANVNLSPLKKGDITMVMSDIPNGKALAKCFLVTEDDMFTLNQRVCSLQAEGIDSEYLYYYINRNRYYLAFDNGVGQTNLRKNDVLECPVLIPPIEEQKQIVKFLKTIDNTISKTEAIIEQTEKVKKGLMQQLLTKGIGHTKFKQTEIGEIPEEWEVKPLEEICERIFVGIATSTTSSYTDNGVLIIRNQNIHEDYLDTSDLLQITDEFSEKNKNKKLKCGDILTVRTGYPGVSCVVSKEIEGSHTFTTLVSRPLSNIVNSYYLSRYINSETGKRFVTGGKAGGAQQNLNVAIMKKLPLALPQLDEQVMIVNIIDSIDKKASNEKTKLNNLKIFKQGLMQALLTGKVRVKVNEQEVI